MLGIHAAEINEILSVFWGALRSIGLRTITLRFPCFRGIDVLIRHFAEPGEYDDIE
jgi:hypothetical protein